LEAPCRFTTAAGFKRFRGQHTPHSTTFERLFSGDDSRLKPVQSRVHDNSIRIISFPDESVRTWDSNDRERHHAKGSGAEGTWDRRRLLPFKGISLPSALRSIHTPGRKYVINVVVGRPKNWY